MISDAKLLYADDATFDVANLTPELSTNVYDSAPLFGTNSGVDLGTGTPLYLFIQVGTAFDSTGDSSTLTIEFQSSAAAAMTTPTTHWTSGAILEATLAAGYVLKATLPPDQTYLQYTAFLLTSGGEDITAGTLTLAVVPGVSTDVAYDSALNF